MERERWQLVEKLYHAALEYELEKREAFLKEASPDEDVRREVDSLLRFDGAPVSMFDQPAWDRRLRRGDRLGPYEIIERIGRGGMGEVWKAHDSRLQRIVAIKSPAARFSERIEREARAIAALNHPNICAIFDVGPDYLVMEYVEGSPLRGPIPLPKTLEYAQQILDALDAAHSRGIVHRDLKPANILVTKAGVKLVDFGLARWERAGAAAAGSSGLTLEGMVAGTPEYMAPEQAAGGTVDSRADIYAFGCVFFEMLTGKRISAASPAQTIGVPGDGFLDAFLHRCLLANPEDRWQSARDVKAALILKPDVQPGANMNRRKWIAAAAAGIGAGALAGGGAVAWLPRNHERAKSLRVDISPPEGGQFPAIADGASLALSPDGRAVICVVTLRGKTGLWLRPLDGSPGRLLCETTLDPSPFWSPDSKFVAFRNGRAGLDGIDVAIGTRWTVCERPHPFGFTGGAWNPDGDILLGAQGILRVPASGGTPRQITNPNPSLKEQGHLWPQALPRGRFLYWAPSELPGESGIYVASLSRPAERVRLLATDNVAVFAPGGDGIDYLIWHRQGTLIAQEFDATALTFRGEPHEIVNSAHVSFGSGMTASVSTTGSLLLRGVTANPSLLGWLSREGKLLRTVGEPAEYMTCRLSPDGQRIAASLYKSQSTREIWILDPSREISDRFAACDYGGLSAWSPDGQALTYRTPDANLVRQRLVGNEKPALLATSENAQFVNDWSPDGRYILYQEMEPDRGQESKTDRNWDLIVAEIGLDGKVLSNRPWLSTPYKESDARFAPAPNQQWVSYMSDETGRFEIYIDSFPKPGRKIRVSAHGGRFAQWRGDGRELFFLSADYKLMSVDVSLKSSSVATSEPREMFPLAVAENRVSPYEARRDGQSFLVRMAVHQSSPLTLILNWPALMKAQAAG